MKLFIHSLVAVPKAPANSGYTVMKDYTLSEQKMPQTTNYWFFGVTYLAPFKEPILVLYRTKWI